MYQRKKQPDKNENWSLTWYLSTFSFESDMIVILYQFISALQKKQL